MSEVDDVRLTERRLLLSVVVGAAKGTFSRKTLGEQRIQHFRPLWKFRLSCRVAKWDNHRYGAFCI